MQECSQDDKIHPEFVLKNEKLAQKFFNLS